MANLRSDYESCKSRVARPRLRLVPGRPAITKHYQHGESAPNGSMYCRNLDIFCTECGHEDACDRALEGRTHELRWEVLLHDAGGFHNMILPDSLSLPGVFRRMRAEHPGAVLAHIARQVVQA